MKKLSLILLALANFSCQEEVDLDLKMDALVPVIEAVWTDRPFYNEVTITLAQDYFDSASVAIVKNAEVKIVNITNQDVVTFVYDPDSYSYKPPRPGKVAQIGETYQLSVKWDDNEYVSQGVMLEPPIIDSLTYDYQEERLFRGEGYYIKVFGQIPFEENNYYRIRVIENDTLKNDRNDYMLFDDTFGLAFFDKGLELDYKFGLGDEVRLELQRLNESAYTYLFQLVNLLYNDGGLFSPPPQNPDTNIIVIKGNSNVLGYFNVTPILTSTVVIAEEEN